MNVWVAIVEHNGLWGCQGVFKDLDTAKAELENQWDVMSYQTENDNAGHYTLKSGGIIALFKESLQ